MSGVNGGRRAADSRLPIGWQHEVRAILRRSPGSSLTACQGGHREAGHVLVQFVAGDADGRGDRSWSLTIVATERKTLLSS